MSDPLQSVATGPAVLVVDDNVDACRALAMLLGAHGFRVESANDAGTALIRARALEPAAVILDLHLPDGHGVEVMNRLRGEPWAHRCAFIAVSGDEDAGEQAGDAGFGHVMVKPLDFDDLLRCLGPIAVD